MAYWKYNREHSIFAFHFDHIYGGGWESDIVEIVNRMILPERIERKLYKAGWYSSDSGIFFYKNGVEAIVHLDDGDSIAIYTKDPKCTEEQLGIWANIINAETEKINSTLADRRKK